jgi:hypothetical protein
MFNHHKRRMKMIKKEKKKNHSKETTSRKKSGGTGTLEMLGSMYGIAPYKQYSIDHRLEKRIVLGKDLEYYKSDTVEEPYSGTMLAKHGGWHKNEPVQPPIDQRGHDRTRWKQKKWQSKRRNRQRINKELRQKSNDE